MVFWHLFHIQNGVVSGDNKDVKCIDNSKITGYIATSFDKKVVSDEEFVDFTIEVHNVKKWYMSLEHKRQWPPGCVTKIAKNTYCKRDLRYQFQEKPQPLYRIIMKKDHGKMSLVYKFL